MLKQVCLSLSILGFASLAYAQGLPSQSSPVIFETHFAFYAGDHLVPAGTYVAQWKGNGYTIITGKGNGSTGAILPCVVGARAEIGNKPTGPAVVFTKYGEQYFLSQVWQGTGIEGLQARKSKKEHDSVEAHGVVVVQARNR